MDSEGTNESEYNIIVLNGGKIVFAGGSVENTNTSGKTINVTYSGAVTVSANTGVAIFL